MTTDITELAQSLKNAAEKAQIEEGPTWFSEEQLSHEDGLSLHKADAEFISLANPANILALVEALEKAQQRIAELESRTVKLPKFKMLEDYLAEVAIEERKQILVGVKLEFHRALSDAGIKVEAE
ncbi:ead/Ea22-like family protein [Raoultella ornithinolytica]|uniref:ead/Ea22-like family protein n=1 Tax=Raoultella ornithinolytica TaxID=54291 RepID=UPI001F30E1A6|nr:ead/Ea22-like family protein [Raoultella ornithinolytica]MCF6660673.1 ead/Ea22-like family protein [Raoultella ornithinolytica]